MQKLRLKPAASLMIDCRPAQLQCLSQKRPELNKQDTTEDIMLDKPQLDKDLPDTP